MKVKAFESSGAFHVELEAETAAEAAMLCRMGLQSKAHEGAAPHVYALAEKVWAGIFLAKVAPAFRTSRISRK